MLRAKKERNYRKGSTWRSCSDCDHYVGDFEVRACTSGNVLKIEGRCRLIGLQHGRMYRILPHYICDAFNGTERLKKVKGL